MNISQVQVKNFRNYEDLLISFDQGVQVFSGCNAQGKTNFLEAIFLSVLGKSFRSCDDDEMIKFGFNESLAKIDFQNRVAEHSVSFRLKRGKLRENVLNGQNVKKKAVVGLLNAVLFFPEDLWLIKGSPSIRRRFIDFEISQTNPVYYQALLQYNRALYQRNQLLKQINEGFSKRNLIASWDDVLIELAEKLIQFRILAIQQLSDIANKVHKKITNGAEDFSAHYFVFGRAQENEESYKKWYAESLKISLDKDIRRGTTEFGPHRDDLIFLINSLEGKNFASQGQQRTAVLSLKLAEIEVMYQIMGEYPILLLDDVMSELDEKRRVMLIHEIKGKAQTFITGTERMDELKDLNPTYYVVDSGEISLQKRIF